MGEGYIIVVLLCMAGCLFLFHSCTADDSIRLHRDMMLKEVDNLILNYDVLIEREKDKLDSLKEAVSRTSGEKKVELYDDIFGKYLFMNNDSAIAYAKKMIEASYDTVSRVRGNYNLARANLCRGHETDAYAILRKTFPDTSNIKVKPYYYGLMVFRKELLGENPINWHVRFRKILPSGSVERLFSDAYVVGFTNNPGKGIALLEKHKDMFEKVPEQKAKGDYLEAEMLLQEADTVGALGKYAESAIYHLRHVTHDYRALGKLAYLLGTINENSRAYDYISFASGRVSAAKVAGEITLMNTIMLDVVKMYEDKQKRMQKRKNMMLCCISVLTVILAVCIVWLVKSRRRIKADMAIQKEQNENLSLANQRLEYSDKIKMAYLLQYMNQCSINIDNLERFKSKIKTAIRSQGLKGAESVIVKDDFQDESKKFYAEFDKLFIDLFPDFVDRLNMLLRPECAVSISKDGGMTGELRTMALIALGITDSNKIAAFLRKSVSTVYNYRVKMRNASCGERNVFEDEVADICRQRQIFN